MNPFQLALRVLRGDKRGLVSAVLTACGVAIAVTLVTWLAAVPGALQARADHQAWRSPGGETSDSPGVLVSQQQDAVHGQRITRINVAALTDNPPAAPGLVRVPKPGEVLLSPALAALARELPVDQLAKRFPGKVIAEIGNNALVYPEELVAVVGVTKESLGDNATSVAGLVGRTDPQPEFILLLLSQVGLVVLVVPSLVLIASSAKLTAARRERRLAALRLAGATPQQVIATTAVEIAIAAIVGTAVGLLLSPLARELTATLPWDGGTWFPEDLMPSVGLVIAIAVLTPLLVVSAAVLGLRRVLTQPLGAAQQHRKKAPSPWRLLALVGAAGAFLFGFMIASETGGISVLIGALAAIAVAASIVGPWVTGLVGRWFTSIWRRPATLLAGRRLRDDPKAAYRAASGVVLAVFAGTMALTILPSLEGKIDDRVWRSWKEGVLYADTPASEVPRALTGLRAELAKRGIQSPVATSAKVTIKSSDNHYLNGLVISCADAKELTWLPVGDCTGQPGIWLGQNQKLPSGPLTLETYSRTGATNVPLPPNPVVHQMLGSSSKSGGVVLIDPTLIPRNAELGLVTVTVMSNPQNAELVRTLLLEQLPGSRIDSLERLRGRDVQQLTDIRRIAMIGLIIAGLLGGISAAITATGSIMDRRRTLAALIAAGTPSSVLAKALRTEAALPSLIATLGSGIAGFVVGAALVSLINIPVLINGWLAVPLLVGFGVALLAAISCGPLLRRISAQSYAQE